MSVHFGPKITLRTGGFPGKRGQSTYESYVATTSDDPILSEAEWAAGSNPIELLDNDIIKITIGGQVRYFACSETNPLP